MKVILFSLLVLIMVGSCYFADKQSEKRTAHQKTAQAALLETPAEAPQEVVVEAIPAAPEKAAQETVVLETAPEKVAPKEVVAEPVATAPPVQETVVLEPTAEKAAPKEVAAEPVVVAPQETVVLEPAPEKKDSQEVAEKSMLEELSGQEVVAEKPASEPAQKEVLKEEVAEMAQEAAPLVQESKESSSEWNGIEEMGCPPVAACCEDVCEPVCDVKRWYLEFKPGYYYLTDKLMRQFFHNGGFTFRVETGYRFWKPFMVWLDGSYFQKKGTALGTTYGVELKLATITLGLKTIWDFNDYAAFYVGAGPRVFMMEIHNESPFVPGKDGAFGIGLGADGGFWLTPIPAWRNLILDFFADYSWKKLKIDEDEISSTYFDVDVSGLTFGAGLGLRF